MKPIVEARDALDPEQTFVVTVADAGSLVLETPLGRVGKGWRLFVDERTAGTAQPGELVAAMSRDGRLVVGELAQDDAGERELLTGAGRVPIAADGVRGTVVEYHQPPCTTGWIVR